MLKTSDLSVLKLLISVPNLLSHTHTSPSESPLKRYSFLYRQSCHIIHSPFFYLSCFDYFSKWSSQLPVIMFHLRMVPSAYPAKMCLTGPTSLSSSLMELFSSLSSELLSSSCFKSYSDTALFVDDLASGIIGAILMQLDWLFTIILTSSILFFLTLSTLILPSSHAIYIYFPIIVLYHIPQLTFSLDLGLACYTSHSITMPFKPVLNSLRVVWIYLLSLFLV